MLLSNQQRAFPMCGVEYQKSVAFRIQSRQVGVLSYPKSGSRPSPANAIYCQDWCLESTVFLAWWQVKILLMETLEHLFAILGEIWPADRRNGSCEESRLPLLVCFFAFRSLLPLLLFDLGLQIGSQAVLFAYYSVCYAIPELERLVGKLLFHRGYDFRHRIERVEIDDEVLFLRKF